MPDVKTAAELFAELNQLDERLRIEAKTGAGRSLMETICAFSNEPNLGGGTVLVGVAPVESSLWAMYEVIGLDNPDQIQADIATQCATAFNTVIRPEIIVEKIHDKIVLVLNVPEAGQHEKPVHFKNQPLPQSAYRRIGSTDQRCTEDDMVVFYQERRGESFDEQIMRDATRADFDPDAIAEYRRLRKEVNPSAVELEWQDEELLRTLSALKEEGGQFKPTVAGILLFGSAQALRRLFPMMRVDCIRIPGTEWVKDPDRRWDTVEIRAPLIRAVQRARAAILDDLPKAFSLPAGEVQGKEIPYLPDRVIREVVANAVMHRSYRLNSPIQIIRYSNRLEIRSPGFSLKAQERLGEPGSEPRNPKIAAVFHEVNLAETKGSGIRVMRNLMDEKQLPPPVLQSDRTNNSFMALLLFHHFLGQKDLDWLNGFKEMNLSTEDMRALVSAREVGAIDNSSYRDINRDSDTLAASKHLRRLRELGLLQMKGQGSATFYVPTSALLDPWRAIITAGEPSKLGALSSESSTLSSELVQKPSEFSPKPSQLPKPSKRTMLIGELPETLREEILTLRRRSSADRLRNLVQRACRVKDFTLDELAVILDRTEVHLRQKVVTPMLREGVLEFTNAQPNDPRQRYRARSPKATEPKDNG